MKNFNIVVVHWKTCLFGMVGGGGDVHELFLRESAVSELPKQGGLGQFADLIGDLAKEGAMFLRWWVERGVRDPNAYYESDKRSY